MPEDSGKLEAALAAIEEEIASAQARTTALSATLKRARTAAQTGRIGELERMLSMAIEAGESAAAAARTLAGKWTFDVKGHFEDGFVAELRKAAATANLNIVERDGRLFAFPIAFKIDRAEVGIRVNKKLERRLRPSVLVKLLADFQKRPTRLSEQRFLDLLHKVYSQLVRSEWQNVDRGQGPIVRLADIHAILTLLPGAEYPTEEFARDLLLLDRKPELRTREGYSFSFPGSALARERVQPIKVYDEEGRERTYLGLTFTKED
jgi:hypothetical protein